MGSFMSFLKETSVGVHIRLSSLLLWACNVSNTVNSRSRRRFMMLDCGKLFFVTVASSRMLLLLLLLL